jgi:hypothetical protein
MNDRLFSNRKIPWPWEKSITVTAENECWRQFATAVSEAPVLFRLGDSQSQILLSVGHEQFILSLTSEDYSLAHAGANRNRSLRLGSLWKPGDPPEMKIGFCPAVLKRQSGSTPARRPRSRAAGR